MRTMIVGVHYPAIHAVFEMMMQELKELALALNIEVQYSFVQNLPVPDKTDIPWFRQSKRTASVHSNRSNRFSPFQ